VSTASTLRRRLRLLALLPLTALGGGCDMVKSRIKNAAKQAADPTWQSDSGLVAGHPNVLFRVVRSGDSTFISPIATVNGATRRLVLRDRGWRYFDLTYLQAGMKVTPYRDGEALPEVTLRRGMWEGSALDTLGCPVLVPKAILDLPAGVEVVTSAPAAAAGRGPTSDGEVQSALAGIANLVAPPAGVPPSMISRYQRTVHVVSRAKGEASTIVAVYDDPEVVPDTLNPLTARPRHLIVILDKSVYGYKPGYVYKTVANAQDLPRRRFLGAVDIDGDGVSELLFGVQDTRPRTSLVTYALQFEVNRWRDSFKYELSPCQNPGG